MTLTNQDIINYYDNCEIDFKLLWHLNSTYSMHYGISEKGSRSIKKAIQNMNIKVAEIANITKESKVLDAGCGVGGTAIYLAKKYGCKITGITLCQEQVKNAKKNIKKEKIDHLIDIKLGDYHKTNFPKSSFDVIIGLESICYANKPEFLKEAYRLLKSGGKLIIADGFNSYEKYNKKNNIIMRKWLNGWAVNSLATPNYFAKVAEKIGYDKITYMNVTKQAMPSSRRLFIASFPGLFVTYVLNLFKIRNKIQTKNVISAFYQYIALRKKLWEYGIFYAEKTKLSNTIQ